MGNPGHPAAPVPGGDVREIDLAHRDPARVGFGEAQQQRQERGLARAAAARHERGGAGAQHQVDARQRRFRAARVGQADAVEADLGAGGRLGGSGRLGRGPAGAVQDREHPPGGRDALHARVEPRPDLAQRQVGLRSEDQDEQGGVQVELAVEQPQPHLDGHQGHRDRREQLQDERREERDAQRAHRGAAVLVGHAADQFGLGLRPAEDRERRQALDHVEEMAAEPLQQPPLAGRPVLGVPADQGHEHRDQRHGAGDDQRGDPVGARHDDQHGDGHEHGEHELGQVAGHVVVERVEAPGREGGELARVGRHGVGGRAGHVGDQPAAQIGLDARRAAQGRGLGPVGQDDPGGHDEGERRERGRGRPARDHPRQQPGLHQDQPGQRRSARDRDDEVDPDRPGGRHQPRVQRLHAVTRRRKTQ